MSQFHYTAPCIDPFRRQDEPTGFALVKRAPAVLASECELPGVASIEVMILWGETVLHVAHLTPPRAYFVGETSTADAPCDFIVPAERLGADRVQLVEMIDGVPHVAGKNLALGERSELGFGDIVVRIAATAAGKPTPRRAFAGMRSAFASFGFASAMTAALVGAMTMFTPTLGLAGEADEDRDAAYAAEQYLAASAEREHESQLSNTDGTPDIASRNGSGAAAQGSEGAMGTRSAPLAAKRFGVKGPKDNPDVRLSRDAAIGEAQSFGMIGLLGSTAGGSNAPTAPWGRDAALGNDDMNARGNMWGDEIGDAPGFGALRLSGHGIGGGDTGQGIALGHIGTCESGVCSGFSAGTAFGSHATTAPGARRPETTVSGALPPAVIQRVVRQNFGRFRQCYETGLQKNPNLAGRVAVRFVIGRDGSVANAMNGGSDLPDSGVVSCVVGAYYGLSFPAPDNGIVTVTYPIAFSPG